MAHHLPAIMMDMSVLVAHQQNPDAKPVFFPDSQVSCELLDGVLKKEYLALFSENFLAGKEGSLKIDSLESAARLDPLLRQLCWEFHSPTSLRHIAAISGNEALLPDPFNCQGGLYPFDAHIIDSVAERHPVTGLLTQLRVEVVLACQNEDTTFSLLQTETGVEKKLTICPGQMLLTPVKGITVKPCETAAYQSYIFYLYANDRARSLEERQKAFENY